MRSVRCFYHLVRPWSRDDYLLLLDGALELGDSFLLVEQDQLPLKDRSFLERLEPFRLSTGRVTEWPGTRVLMEDACASLHRFRLTDGAVEVLRSEGLEVWSFEFPSMPEDLAFLRADGSPWFESTPHEREAFFRVSASERGRIESSFGEGALVYDQPDYWLSERY